VTDGKDHYGPFRFVDGVQHPLISHAQAIRLLTLQLLDAVRSWIGFQIEKSFGDSRRVFAETASNSFSAERLIWT
jgi:hypothetical protein